MITFTPFPTAILAEYLGSEGKFALAIFGFNYFLIAIASYWICAYPYNRRLIDDEDREFFHCVKLTYGYAIIYTLIAFLICFISIPAAIVLYLLLFYVFAFPERIRHEAFEKKTKENQEICIKSKETKLITYRGGKFEEQHIIAYIYNWR